MAPHRPRRRRPGVELRNCRYASGRGRTGRRLCRVCSPGRSSTGSVLHDGRRRSLDVEREGRRLRPCVPERNADDRVPQQRRRSDSAQHGRGAYLGADPPSDRRVRSGPAPRSGQSGEPERARGVRGSNDLSNLRRWLIVGFGCRAHDGERARCRLVDANPLRVVHEQPIARASTARYAGGLGCRRSGSVPLRRGTRHGHLQHDRGTPSLHRWGHDVQPGRARGRVRARLRLRVLVSPGQTGLRDRVRKRTRAAQRR